MQNVREGSPPPRVARQWLRKHALGTHLQSFVWAPWGLRRQWPKSFPWEAAHPPVETTMLSGGGMVAKLSSSRAGGPFAPSPVRHRVRRGDLRQRDPACGTWTQLTNTQWHDRLPPRLSLPTHSHDRNQPRNHSVNETNQNATDPPTHDCLGSIGPNEPPKCLPRPTAATKQPRTPPSGARFV